MEERHFCNFCYSPASHQGGFEYNGNQITGTFCDEGCLKKWATWKHTFLNWVDKDAA